MGNAAYAAPLTGGLDRDFAGTRFAVIKHVATFAIVMLGLAVLVADPGANKSAAPAAVATQAAPADLAAAAPAPAAQAAPVEADPSWYGDDGGEGAQMPAAGSAGDDGYNLAPARPVPPSRSAAAPAPVAAPAAADYIPPPPPPQVPPGA